ncbi:dihydroorotate dehydrogenase 2 [Lentzea sp. NBRC 105346]|uniref:quinone-dependent dihydroorotate dehydrogenase n=1 Tax=Lentzea sp. NBRC 105346 TaxID=3032205 RepID=UPI0024A4BECE|nr:quinone-dependent dihydroorotate dehydrogenase [Lentzea sp. NBRC 105346]GLZ33764.1 dihydroorotate dehydrogenase 2 [Lentzea sp. NBRC 105346]
MSSYERIVRPALFRADPEWIHDRSIRFAQRAGFLAPLLDRVFRPADERLAVDVAGLRMRSPIGLAAGYDKNARAVDLLAALGFGHVEVGSISADHSDGNPRPRLFRLPAQDAIIVYYGLPNDGADRVAERLAARRTRVPVGVNVVNTNRRTEEPEDVIIADYVRSVRTLHDHADYLVLNLSCPNTSDGRGFFHEPRRLKLLLEGLTVAKPLFLKVAPFAGTPELDAFLEAVDGFGHVSGFSINLPAGKPEGVVSDLPGAVSGRPAAKRADETIRLLYQRMDRSRFTIIGSGGVFTAADAYRKFRLGASLVQLFTSLVYRGPGVVRSVHDGLAALLERDGVRRIADVVGVGA